MVANKIIHASNAQISAEPGLTFVFAGATAGIGLSTLKAFARRAVRPTAYIIGRSKARFQVHLDELAKINPEGKWVFLEGQFTLLKEGKRLADEIVRLVEQQEGGGKVDAVIASTGYLTFQVGRHDTEEGIDTIHALIYYNRMLLTSTLLPLLAKSPHGRVIFVLNSTQEGPITLTDLSTEFRTNFSRLSSTFAMASLITLSFEQLAKQYPSVSFIHSFPGLVKTDIIDKLFGTPTGWLWYPAWFTKTFVVPVLWFLGSPFAVSLQESGERHLYLATSGAYPSAAAAGAAAARTEGLKGGVVPLVDGEVVKGDSIVGKDGKTNGVYRTIADLETSPDRQVLHDLRREGLDVAGWRETVKVFDRVLGEGAVVSGL